MMDLSSKLWMGAGHLGSLEGEWRLGVRAEGAGSPLTWLLWWGRGAEQRLVG